MPEKPEDVNGSGWFGQGEVVFEQYAVRPLWRWWQLPRYLAWLVVPIGWCAWQVSCKFSLKPTGEAGEGDDAAAMSGPDFYCPHWESKEAGGD